MEQLEQAKQEALRYVTVRMRTRQEVVQQLCKKGYGTDVADAVIGFLEEYHYLDDEAYCRSWIHDRMAFHPCGRQKMAFELAKKIADQQLISQCLEQYFTREAELELAQAAAVKKLQSGRQTVTAEQLSRFLYSRGYSGSIIRAVLQQEAIQEMIDQRQCNNNF